QPRPERHLSRKISRRYPPNPQNGSQATSETTDDNGAGPSGSGQADWSDTDGVPPSPSTEYPDQFEGLALPSYYDNAEIDPIALKSLGHGPPINSVHNYLGPPPTEFIDESVMSDSPSRSFTESGYLPEGTFMSYDFPILRPPSNSSFHGVSFHHQFDEPAVVETPGWSANNVEIIQSPNLPDDSFDFDPNDEWGAGPSNRRNTNVIEQIKNFVPRPLELHEEEADLYFDDDERRFIDLWLLSNLAVQLYDNVPRGTHVKGSVPYPRAFTGKDVVSTIHSIIQRGLISDHGGSTADRRAALLVARSLQSALFFSEVEWGGRMLQDGVEDVYMFLDDLDSGSDGVIERTELPTGVETILTRCYSASCDGPGCYSYACPRKGMQQLPSLAETPTGTRQEEWSARISPQVLTSLTESQINRQTIIHKLITKEKQYIEDLDIVEKVFITPLRTANPPVMTPLVLEEFIKEVFGNILQLRECNHQLLEVLYVRQREQEPIVQSIGDIFLAAATDFRTVYPIYVGHHPLAEKRMKEELEHNPEFRLFIEKCSRQLSARPGGPRLDLKHYLNRPAEHLQKYPVLLDAVYTETEASNPDGDYLREAIDVIQDLQNVAQLQTFQSAMGKGSTGKWEWHNLVPHDKMQRFTKEESKRQSVIFELIKGEMAYVRDLENIETMYVRPLRNAEPPIIPPARLEQFLTDVFHNFNELHMHHRRLVDRLHEIQRDEHPRIRSITPAVLDAALNFREAYMEYIPNYPIAAYRIVEEIANNPDFKAFVNHTIRHPDAHRLDMKSFINRPIPRLLRYELLLNEILKETSPYDEDRSNIPDVMELIKALVKETEPGVSSSKQKVELWRYNSNLAFKNGEHVDMDLLNDQRSLIHTGKLWDKGRDGWAELFVILFDNYLVMTKPKEKDDITKYHVYRKPLPLDLLTLVNFTIEPVVQRNNSFLRALRNSERGDTASIISRSDTSDPRSLYPCNLHYHGRNGGPSVLYAESSASRVEWKQKLEEALGLRKVVQESNKVFEIESLSVDTFKVAPPAIGLNPPGLTEGIFFTGEVTCSVPFNTHDGRCLVAIGCAEGVWIGYRHDSRSMSRVLHLKKVTQCAVLDEFGLFLVLADKVLYAYHLEALVPTSGTVPASQSPQKINSRDVHFFSIGVLHGRTLVIYMKKRGNGDSVFHAVEPVIDKINEVPKPSGGLLPSLKRRAEWFRPYKEFSFPDAFDLIFLKNTIAVLCTKGFNIMGLRPTDIESVTIPQRDDVNFAYLPKRCESCRPLGMFRLNDAGFLLCYDEFGVFVDNNGKPKRSTGIIEWEGKAERVAMHMPYILLFDIHFIEIRHIETGHLVQIIPGTEIRCVWDGRVIDEPGVTSPNGQVETMVQEPRIHAVMNTPEHLSIPRRPGRCVVQHVFELFPTIPLYLPGSLSSPSTTSYFPRSFSPPRSPIFRLHQI
ncbi:Dbl homology domain-containing protein, partial [Phlegmacium glaucopus]